MTTATKKNNIEEQKNDLREMASLLKEMSKEDRKKLKYVMVGMQLVKDIEKAGQEGKLGKDIITTYWYT